MDSGSRARSRNERSTCSSRAANSLLALSNWAYLVWQKGEKEEAGKHLRRLQELSKGDPVIYDDLEWEAQSEILYLYIKLGHLFEPYAVSDLQETLLSRRPHDDRIKYTLALTLRRYIHNFYASRHPEVDFVPAIRRAIQLFVEIKDNKNNSHDLRAKAAAELGEIFDWQNDERIRAAMEAEKQKLGLTSTGCFDEAIQLADSNPMVLVRAGKHFRYKNQLLKSKDFLEKAVAMRPEGKAHHHLGLTLKKLALQENQPQQPQGWSRENHGPNQTPNSRSNTHQAHGGREGYSGRTNRNEGDGWRTGGDRGDNWRARGMDGASWRTGGRGGDDWRTGATGRDSGSWRTTGRDGGNLRSGGRTGDDWRTGRGGAENWRRTGRDHDSWRTTNDESNQNSRGRSQDGWRQQFTNPRTTRTGGYKVTLSKDGKYVQEAMEHFRKSLEHTNGESFPALNDLGLMHSALGEYDQALEQFRKITEIFPPTDPNFTQGLEQAGQVYAEMADREVDHEKRASLQEMSCFCFNLMLSNLCHQLDEQGTTERNETVWFSFHSLQQALRQHPRKLTQGTSKEEGMLLKTAKTYSMKRLPVLVDISSVGERQATDAHFLKTKVQMYLSNGQYGDALLFLDLLKLTKQNHVLGMWQDADLCVRIQVLLAKDCLLRGTGSSDVSLDIIIIAAKLMFQRAFEEVFSNTGSFRGLENLTDCAGNYKKQNLSNLVSLSTFPTSGSAALEKSPSPPQLDDEEEDVLHVLLLHDRQDKEAERDVRNLQNVLQQVYGLKATLMTEEELYGADRSALMTTAMNAQLLLCLLRSTAVSAEFEKLIEEAVNLTAKPATDQLGQPQLDSSPFNIVTVLLDNLASLPRVLQGHRSLTWTSEKLDVDPQWWRSEVGVNAACQLFCLLIGLQKERGGVGV